MGEQGRTVTSENIPALLRETAAIHGDREAIVDGDVRLTYSELLDRVNDAARAFVKAGVQPGDRVAIWAPNIWEWPVVLLGLQSAGAALVPLNTRYKGTEAAHILDASGARMLFTVEGFLGTNYVSMLDEPRSNGACSALERIVVLRGKAKGEALSFKEFLSMGSDVALAEIDARVEAIEPNSMSDLLFTSGTTGAPKGVMCTHSQTVRAFNEWANLVGLTADDRYLIINPFFHSFGYKAGIVSSLTKGATMVPQVVFDVPQAMELIEGERISMIPGPPTLYQTIMNHPEFDAAKLSTLRLAVTGAAAIPVSLIEDMRSVLGFETVLTAYGLTEACGIATVSRADDPPEVIANYSGRAIDGVEVRIIDEEGNTLVPGVPGEVVIRGYNVMLGYFNDPQQTREAIDNEGWLHTGDIGVMNEQGYLDITDRKKDMYIVGGFNAYPAEIESLLTAHPDIAQVSVVGIPDERQGEVGYAFVVPTGDAVIDPADIVAWSRQNMANYKVPRHVEVVSELPLNASGKVLKFELRDRAIAAVER